MDTNNPRMVALRNRVKAASEELEGAIAYHEAWKPSAFDKKLHLRMGTSHATQTFLVIRLALRREMVMALMRLWDDDKRTIRLPSVASALRNQLIIGVLVDEVTKSWTPGQIGGCEPLSEEAGQAIREDIANEAENGLRNRALEAIALIDKYGEGGTHHHVLLALREIRDQHLAHRQLKRAVATRQPLDAAIEQMYKDMLELLGLLWSVVLHTAYNLTETAGVREVYARQFWAGVRGEKTKGHPNYRGIQVPAET